MTRPLPTPDLLLTRAAVMTIAFQCSGCGATLRVPDTMAGRRGKCPKCAAVNSIPGAEGQVQTAPSPRAAARPAKEAPPPEPAEEGEEAAEATPRPRRKGKKRGKRTLLFVGLGCGGLLLLTCMGAGAGVGIWWYMSSPIGDELTYMPANAEVIASVRLDQLLASEAYKQVEKEAPQLKQVTGGGEAEKEIGLSLANVERLVVGGASGGGQPVVAVLTKQPVKAEDLVGKIKGKSFTGKKVGSYTLYEAGADGFSVVGKKLVVFGPARAVQDVLTRNKKPDFSPRLSAAMKEADFSKTIVLAAGAKPGGGKGAANFGGFPLGGGVPLVGDDDVEGVVLQAKVTADLSLTCVVLCKDAATATVAKRKLDEGLAKLKSSQEVPPDLRNAFDLKLSVSGRKVTATSDIKVAPLIKSVKNKLGTLMK